MAKLTQEPRLISVETPLGKDVLVLVSFSGREELSRLFQYDLLMLSEKDSLKPQDIVGKNVTFAVRLADGKPRYFNGVVSRFANLGKDTATEMIRYRAEVVPWLWFLTRTADCRIFQEKSLPDIIEQIFQDLGFSDFDKSGVQGDHPTHEYCVQYRETDFNFVSRLLEEEGIFYYFRHEKGKHTLVLADRASAYEDCAEKDVEFESLVGSRAITDHIDTWEHQYEFRPGKFAHTDYNFETPSTDLMSKESSTIDLPGIDKFEIYDYPGLHIDKDQGRNYARLRAEELEVPFDVATGAGGCKSFSPGGKFKFKRHDLPSEEGKSYVITKIHHKATEPGGYTPGAEVDEVEYRNEFRCIPDSVVFRPERITPKPQIHGVQTAVVVGPPGETIFPDKYARIKVQFYWDREGKKDDKSSCWMRVAQNWGGSNWGGIFIPHVGQEVIVSFLEGDPDRPIITGRVYNAEQMPPLELPANKTKSAIRDHGGNEIIMEGVDGGQQVFIHSPTSNSMITIGAARNPPEGISATTDAIATFLIGKDVKWEVGVDEHKKIWGNKETAILGYKTDVIQGLERKHVFGATITTIGGGKKELIVGAEIKNVLLFKHDLTAGARIQIIKGADKKSYPQAYRDAKAKIFEKAVAIQNKASEIKQSAGKHYRNIKGKIVDKANEVMISAGTVKEDIKSAISRKASSISEKISGAVTTKASAIKTYGKLLHERGKAKINELISK